jgi:hypothetical protein
MSIDSRIAQNSGISASMRAIRALRVVIGVRPFTALIGGLETHVNANLDFERTSAYG